MMAHISLLPNREQKDIKEFFKFLQGDEGHNSNNKIEDGLEALKKAKEMYKKMT